VILEFAAFGRFERAGEGRRSRRRIEAGDGVVDFGWRAFPRGKQRRGSEFDDAEAVFRPRVAENRRAARGALGLAGGGESWP